MYLLHRAGGLDAQEELWGFLDGGLIELHPYSYDELISMRALMRQFADSPMDLADASIVVASDVAGANCVFTLDRHFFAYRTPTGRSLQVVPT